jgi:hypothetical protein
VNTPIAVLIIEHYAHGGVYRCGCELSEYSCDRGFTGHVNLCSVRLPPWHDEKAAPASPPPSSACHPYRAYSIPLRRLDHVLICPEACHSHTSDTDLIAGIRSAPARGSDGQDDEIDDVDTHGLNRRRAKVACARSERLQGGPAPQPVAGAGFFRRQEMQADNNFKNNVLHCAHLEPQTP